jgi:metal-dependent amidase/aminoacylase/carboxypeptidase family protein
VIYGPMLAAPDTFEISINGGGDLAAMPYQTADAIAIGAQVVANLQHVVSRNVDPQDNVVVSVTKFAGGTIHNVIPGTVKVAGTARTLDEEVGTKVPEPMWRITEGATTAHDASYSFE